MAEYSVEDDLDVAWSKTVEQCQDIAGWKWKEANRNITINQVIGRIQPTPKDPKLQDKAKAVLSKALTCLDRFGSIVAQATSVVFGPSQQVMNGISFLINVTGEYERVFSGFVTIMERMAAFLQRMNIYLDSQSSTLLDKRLRPDVYEVLNHFIMVLAHSHGLMTSKIKKAKLIAGLLFFGDDQGVSSSLAKLELKISNVSRTEITLILRGVSDAARDVRAIDQKIDRLGVTTAHIDTTVTRTEASVLTVQSAVVRTEVGLGQLLAEQERRTAKDQTDRNTATIKKLLNLDDKSSPWFDSHTNLQNHTLKGTGDWLMHEHQAFQRWADPEDTSTNVFGLSGSEGYGKSCICSSVVQWLLERFPKGRNDHRVAVAYYFFQRDAKEKASIDKAVRALLWQLTQYHASYATAVASAFEGSETTYKALELWQKLIDEIGKDTGGTFYIILDGIDEPETDVERTLAVMIKNLLSAVPVEGQRQTRVLVSGRPSGFETLEKDIANTIPEVTLGTRPGSDEAPMNQADILSYIEQYLNKMDVFKEGSSDDVLDLRKRIPDELAAGVKGDFVSLTYKLDEISNCTRVRQIEDILHRASETREDAIKREIENLNSVLSRDDIGELNEMLNFLLGAMDIEALGWTDTGCLEALLLLKTGTPAVVPLAKQIKSRYSSLLDVDQDDFVTLLSDNIRDYLLASDREYRQIQRPNAEVQDAEIAIVKRVVNTFCGEDLYKRFNFEDFFNAIGGEKALRIHVEEGSIHTKIVQVCLSVLCDNHDDDKLSSLRDYARMCLVDHLGKIDQGAISEAIARDITSRLCKLFMEPAFIDAWWENDFIGEYFEYFKHDWIQKDGDEESDSDTDESSDENSGTGSIDQSEHSSDETDPDEASIDYTKIVTEWLRNSTIGSVEPSVRNWIDGAVSGDQPGKHILERVLRRLLERWFKGPAHVKTVYCIYGLFGKVFQRTFDFDEPKLVDLEEIVAWARKEVAENYSEAHFNWRVAVSMKICELYQEAIARCRKALDEEPTHWQARLCLAEALLADGQTEAACACFKELDELSASLVESDELFADRYWKDILRPLADSYVSLEKPDVAAEIYRRVIDHEFHLLETEAAKLADNAQYEYAIDYDDESTYFHQATLATVQLLYLWNNQGKHAEMLSELRAMEYRDTGYTGTRLAGFVYGHADDSDLQKCLRALVTDAETFDFVDQAYVSAIEITDTDNLGHIIALNHNRAMLAWLCGGNNEVRERSFRLWTDIISTSIPSDDETGARSRRAMAARELPKVLLQRAKEVGPGSPEAEPYVSQLESTAKITPPVLFSVDKSTALALGRYYHLASDDDRAKSVLTERMNGLFQDWDEGPMGYSRHISLAHTFAALDDDTNALAAWKLLAPVLPSSEPNEDAVNQPQEAVETDLADAECKDHSTDDDSNGTDEDDDEESSDVSPEEEQATAGANADQDTDATSSDGDDRSSNEDEPNDEVALAGLPDEVNLETTAVSEIGLNGAEDDTPVLKGWLHSYCDGCGISWTYVDNIYCCKDCLDVQLEPNCYAALQAGTLDPQICSKSHSHLHIPPFDEAEWRALAAEDNVKVGDLVMPRKQWLKDIKREWGIDTESRRQLLAAVKAIERFRKVVLAKRRKKALAGAV